MHPQAKVTNPSIQFATASSIIPTLAVMRLSATWSIQISPHLYPYTKLAPQSQLRRFLKANLDDCESGSVSWTSGPDPRRSLNKLTIAISIYLYSYLWQLSYHSQTQSSRISLFQDINGVFTIFFECIQTPVVTYKKCFNRLKTILTQNLANLRSRCSLRILWKQTPWVVYLVRLHKKLHNNTLKVTIMWVWANHNKHKNGCSHSLVSVTSIRPSPSSWMAGLAAINASPTSSVPTVGVGE